MIGSLLVLIGIYSAWMISIKPKSYVDRELPAALDEQAKEAKKLRGRLPAYYGKVVSDKQRQEIYKIQAKFNEQIMKLKEQLAELVTKRDTEVEQVLSDEQRAEIAKLKEARRSRRSSSEKDTTASGQ